MKSAPAPGPDLAGVIQRLARASVLVVGDTMLDRYVFGNATRLSPEAPVPVLAVEREVALPGGAGNVVRNLTALGAAAALVSVVGDDQAGSDLTGLIGGQLNVEPWLLVQGSRCTTVKSRFVAEGQQLLRADQEVTSPIETRLAERMLRIAADALAATSVTVLSDYGKGVLAGKIPARLIASARDAGRPVIVDTRGTDLDRFAGADVAVLTTRALAFATGMTTGTEAHIAAAANWLRTAHGFGAVAVNRRAEGFCVVSADGAHMVPPAAGEPFNFSGAGDTAVSAIAASLAVGATLVDAVRIAALAVSVCASQPGMPVATAAELLAVLTPQGQVRRKIMSPVAAAAQIAHWRRAGLRTGLTTTNLPAADLDALRTHCDRLVLGLEAPDDTALAVAAARDAVDLVCPFEPGAGRDALNTLRPDLLLSTEGGEALTTLVESWGGSVVNVA
jgi:D-beta-D-heptose 7-phosphate kinase/D-beta-D-heptose 1-phosphate adenosyltransferase